MKGSTTIPSKVNQQAQIEKTKKTKSKPVYYPYIEHYILILKILFAGGKNRNKIFESVKENKDSKIPYQSGKVVTIDAINDLLKYELVKEIVVPIQKKSRRRYGKRKKPTIQKKIIELTRLGYELSNLIHFIDDYRDKYAYLKEKINYHFDIYSDNKTDIASAVRRHRLEQRGWNDEQIINYDKL